MCVCVCACVRRARACVTLYLSTPAQYFHVLRRQLMRPFRKPLILMTPKSMLRNPQAVSTEADFTGEACFREMIDDDALIAGPSRITRLVFCSGKVFYDLLNYRNEQKLKNTAIIRIEQLYPFHDDMLQQIIARYPRANKKWVWCQEEPLNMGAWAYVVHKLERFTEARVRYAGRDRAASPAVGSSTMHKAEQKQLVERAFEV